MGTTEYASSAASLVRTSWDEIAEGVIWLPLSIVNVYLIDTSDGDNRSWVLVDAGLRTSADAIRAAVFDRFGKPLPPRAIVLTHGHFDHVGALTELNREWKSPIFAHELELPYLTGRCSYPPPDPAVGGGAMSFLSRLFPRGPIDLAGQVRPLPADGTIPFLERWLWISTPGHSPGHISLFRPLDRVLIAGDAFVTTVQESVFASLSKIPVVHRCPAYFTCNWDQALDSIRRLAMLQPLLAATGHGIPMRGQALETGLAELIETWQTRGRPSYGRYVRTPALVDASGVLSTPPPVLDRSLLWGLAAALGVMVWANARRH